MHLAPLQVSQLLHVKEVPLHTPSLHWSSLVHACASLHGPPEMSVHPLREAYLLHSCKHNKKPPETFIEGNLPGTRRCPLKTVFVNERSTHHQFCKLCCLCSNVSNLRCSGNSPRFQNFFATQNDISIAW